MINGFNEIECDAINGEMEAFKRRWWEVDGVVPKRKYEKEFIY